MKKLTQINLGGLKLTLLVVTDAPKPSRAAGVERAALARLGILSTVRASLATGILHRVVRKKHLLVLAAELAVVVGEALVEVEAGGLLAAVLLVALHLEEVALGELERAVVAVEREVLRCNSGRQRHGDRRRDLHPAGLVFGSLWDIKTCLSSVQSFEC